MQARLRLHREPRRRDRDERPGDDQARRRSSAGDGKRLEFPVLKGTLGPGRDRHSQALRPDRDVHLRSRLHLHRELQLQHHLHRRRRGRPAASRLHDRGSGQEQLVPRGRLPDPERRAADQAEFDEFHAWRHLPHHAARADPLPVPRLPARRAPDGGDDRRRRCPVGLLPRGSGHRRSAPSHDRDLPADRQDPDHRRDVLQIFGRPAVHLSAQRSELCRELPAHDVRGAVRALQGQPGAGQSARPHLHPARRPRAERLDLDGAARRLDRRQPLCGDRRRHRRPVGTGAWRRQRGRGQDAGRDRQPRPDPRVHREGEGQGRAIPG